MALLSLVLTPHVASRYTDCADSHQNPRQQQPSLRETAFLAQILAGSGAVCVARRHGTDRDYKRDGRVAQEGRQKRALGASPEGSSLPLDSSRLAAHYTPRRVLEARLGETIRAHSTCLQDYPRGRCVSAAFARKTLGAPRRRDRVVLGPGVAMVGSACTQLTPIGDIFEDVDVSEEGIVTTGSPSHSRYLSSPGL